MNDLCQKCSEAWHLHTIIGTGDDSQYVCPEGAAIPAIPRFGLNPVARQGGNPHCYNCGGSWIDPDHLVNGEFHCPTHEARMQDWNLTDKEVPLPEHLSLSLLVIDLGTSCVVKVEKGYLSLEPFCLPGDEVRALVPGMNAHVLGHPFDEVRAAIDALDGEKPVPRIEWNEYHSAFQVITEHSTSPAFKHATEEWMREYFSGVPVYEAKKGEWVELTNFGDGQKSSGCIWRYTK